MRVAFVTSRALVDLTDDDRLALPPLADLGIEVAPVVWGSEAKSLLGFDMVVIRSPWDWYERGDEFQAWLRSIAASEVHLANRACSTFLEKGYLRRLEAAGARVVPTEWVQRGERPELARRMSARGWSEIVFKPALSANAARTHRVSLETAAAHDAIAAEALKTGDLMIQQFMPAVAGQGEWSFVFFDGVFSHALRKVAAHGDFRVQTDHGGDVHTEPEPPAALVEQAARMLAATGERWLYARVDAVVHEGALHLMELEVVEPELFLRVHPEAPERFARALFALTRDRGA